MAENDRNVTPLRAGSTEGWGNSAAIPQRLHACAGDGLTVAVVLGLPRAIPKRVVLQAHAVRQQGIEGTVVGRHSENRLLTGRKGPPLAPDVGQIAPITNVVASGTCAESAGALGTTVVQPFAAQ